MKGWKSALFGLGQIFRALGVVRAPLVVSLLGAVGLAVPQQSREILRVLALDFDAQQFQIWSGFAFLMLAALGIWRMAHNLVEIGGGRMTEPVGICVLSWLPIVCGTLVPLGAAYALYSSSSELGQQVLPKEILEVPKSVALPLYDEVVAGSQRLIAGSAIGFAIALLVAVLSVLIRPRLARAKLPTLNKWDLLGRNTARAIVATLVLVIAYYASFPVLVPQALGSVAIFLQFVFFLAFTTSLITLAADRFRIPLISVLFIWALLLSTFDLNDNHIIRPIAVSGINPPNVTSAFNQWYGSRADRLDYERRGEPYPVFLVAASGGGIYAAHHTATALARLQDRCPNFAQHVFAISSVSGGSLGAAVFSSLAKSYAQNGPRHNCNLGVTTVAGAIEQRANQVLARDFLSPVVAVGLFPDFLQRFLPIPIEPFDRGRAFEAALDDAWQRALPEESNPFKKGFLEHWNPIDPMRAMPALVLNTTSVSSGFRVLIRPFADPIFDNMLAPLTGTIGFQSHIFRTTFSDPKLDVTLGAAVGLSARFPWVMPPGSFEVVPSSRALEPEGNSIVERWLKKRSYERLVDGGYYENSGMESILDIIRDLRENLDPNFYHPNRKTGETVEPSANSTVKKFSFHIIVINSYQGSDPGWQGANELLSPVRSMLNTRQQRGYQALFRGMAELMQFEGRPWSAFALNQTDFRFPLGWQISGVTRRLISRHSGEPHAVNEITNDNFLYEIAQKESKINRIRGFLGIGDNSACEIITVLHPAPQDVLKCHKK